MNFVDALTAATATATATLELTLSRLAFSLSFPLSLSNIMTLTLYTCCAVLLQRLTLCQYHDDEAHAHIQTSICLSAAMKMHSLNLMEHLQYPSI